MKVGDTRKIKCNQCGAVHIYTITSHNDVSLSFIAESTCPKIGDERVFHQLSTIL
jgi:hypothetical protein